MVLRIEEEVPSLTSLEHWCCHWWSCQISYLLRLSWNEWRARTWINFYFCSYTRPHQWVLDSEWLHTQAGCWSIHWRAVPRKILLQHLRQVQVWTLKEAHQKELSGRRLRDPSESRYPVRIGPLRSSSGPLLDRLDREAVPSRWAFILFSQWMQEALYAQSLWCRGRFAAQVAQI